MSSASITAEPKAKKKAEVSPEAASPEGSSIGTESIYGAPAGMPAFLALGIQRKLAIGAVDDPLERQADRVAEQVMSGAGEAALPFAVTAAPQVRPRREPLAAAPRVQRKCACEGSSSGQCEECRKRDEELPGTATIQRRANGNGHGGGNGRINGNGQGKGNGHRESTEAPPIVHAALRSPSKPLDDSIRPVMESSFGRDFSDVRVHTDALAAHSATVVNALAYAAGNHLVFAPSQYSPRSERGQYLIAHELAHVSQQTVAPPLPSPRPDRASELIAGSAGVVRRQPAAPATAADFPTTPPETLQVVPAPPKLTNYRYPLGYGELHLSDNYVEDREQMEEIAKKKNVDSIQFFIWQFIEVNDIRPESDPNSDPVRILHVLQQIYKDILDDRRTFTAQFESDGRNVVTVMLDESEKRLKSERIRYGLKPGGMETESASVKGLSAAAQILLTRRQAIEKLTTDMYSHEHLYWMLGALNFLLSNPPTRKDPEYFTLKEEIEKQEKLYDILRDKYVQIFPILAPATKEKEDTSQLVELSKGPSPEMAQAIDKELTDHQKHIDEVRPENKPGGRVNIWTLPNVVTRVKAAKQIAPDTMNAKFIEDKVETEESDKLWTDMLLGLLQLALVILGPETGGFTLILAAGVSVYQAGRSLENYLWETAMAGTDLDKARAISSADPSFMWVALDIVMAAVDIKAAGPALKGVFSALSKQARAVIVAATAEEAIEQGKVLKDLASGMTGIVNGEQLGKQLLEDANRLREAGGSLERSMKVPEKEVKALEEAEKTAETMLKPGLLGEAESAVGKVKVTQSGYIFSCASPCSMIREKYASALARKEELVAELEALEERAQALAKDNKLGSVAKEDIAKRAKQLADEAASLETKLRAVPTPERLEYLEFLKKMAQGNPLLEGLSADALERVLSKAPNIDHMKGQLLEELLGVEGKSMAEAAAASEGRAVEFIPGYRITDKAGQQLTDGVLAVRSGDKLEIVKVFESKAGKASSRGLKRSWKPIEDLSEAAKADLRMTAIDELREQIPGVKNWPSSKIAAQYPDEVSAAMKRLNTSEAGQFRQDIERLYGSDILVDNEPVKVAMSPKTTEFVGVLPEDVSTKSIAKMAQKQGIKFQAKSIKITQADLQKLAEDLAAALPEGI